MHAEKGLVGEEYDEVAFVRLKRALARRQYDVRDRCGAMAGSQDFQRWTVVSPEGQLVIERETYFGLSVEGVPSLIAELKAEFAQKI